MRKDIAIFWFRRDLRLSDNAGLYHALNSGLPVLPIFIFDEQILDSLPKDDPRVSFIFNTLSKIQDHLSENHQRALALYHGNPKDIFNELVEKYSVKMVFANEDYEPYAKERDGQISELLNAAGIEFKLSKDQVIYQKSEVVKDNGDPYVVYTPYMKKWRETFKASSSLTLFKSEDHLDQLLGFEADALSLKDMGFEPSSIEVPDFNVSQKLIDNYADTRNFPAKEGTSRLGPHLRFGTVSVRELVKKVLNADDQTFLNELIWREFFMQILWHYPKTVSEAFKKKYDRIEWRNNEEDFEKWKKGETGYLLVDAGMRQLNATGYMHNRVRMLVASFLCKHLLIDWRWGEAYFAQKLLDYEMSSNVGNWQWAAGSGVDAAPYFRIFNPMTQVDKFDKNRKYISQWIPELEDGAYVPKMVDHKMARERCLEAYKAALN